MSELVNTIHNVESNEITSRPLNADELAVHKAGEATAKDILENAINKESNKAALLAKLGITAEEATLLLS